MLSALRQNNIHDKIRYDKPAQLLGKCRKEAGKSWNCTEKIKNANWEYTELRIQCIIPIERYLFMQCYAKDEMKQKIANSKMRRNRKRCEFSG